MAGEGGAGVHHDAFQLVHVLAHAAAAATADCRHFLRSSDAVLQMIARIA